MSTTPLPHTPSLFSLRSQGETTPSLPWTSISKQSGLYIRHIFIRHLWHPTPFTPDNFFTKHSLQQAPFTPTRHIFTRHLLHPPDNFFTKHILQQAPCTPNTLYTRHLLYQAHLHQTPFTPCVNHPPPPHPLLILTSFARVKLRLAYHEQVFRNSPVFISGTSSSDTFDTRHLLHQTKFSLNTVYNRHLLHLPGTSSPDTFYTRHL